MSTTRSAVSAARSPIRWPIFRTRGVNLGYSTTQGRITTAMSIGYDRRTYFGADGTVLAAANDIVDQSYYANVSIGAPLGPFAAFSVAGYASYLDEGTSELNDALLLGASAAYSRTLWLNLSARAAVSVDTVDSDLLNETNAPALLGLRYDF